MKNFSYFLCTFVLIIFFESTPHASEIYSIIYKKGQEIKSGGHQRIA